MAILHLVFHAPRGQATPTWFGRLGTGDAVLLLGDAVHGIRDRGPWRALVAETEGPRFFALQDDLLRLGIAAPENVGLLDDAGFVELAATCKASVTWS